MATKRTSRSSKLVACVAALAAAALTVGAASGGGKLKDLGHGVEADKIKVGIAIVDYDAIAEHVDFERGDQEETAQVFVD